MPRRRSAGAVCGTSARTASGRPTRASPRPKADASRGLPMRVKCREAADQPADADGGVQEPDAGFAQVEHLERHHDDQDVECSGGQRLRSVETDDQAKPRVVQHGAEARERLPEEPTFDVRRCSARSRAYTHQQQGRQEEDCSGDREDRVGAGRSE